MATVKNETPKSQIIDIKTGELIEIILSAEELDERQTNAAAQQAAVEAKATARASALAKLAELGLTQEEIAAL